MSRRAEQAERTRAAVLDTARRLFAEQGYDATSLQQIADAMGVRKANVYYYFRTNAALLEALLEPMVCGLRALLDTAGSREALVEGFVAQVVSAYRSVGSLQLGDPALRREIEITRELDELAVRALHALYGDAPTADQQAGFWIIQDLGPVLRRLEPLPDDELRAVLVRLCLRALP